MCSCVLFYDRQIVIKESVPPSLHPSHPVGVPCYHADQTIYEVWQYSGDHSPSGSCQHGECRAAAQCLPDGDKCCHLIPSTRLTSPSVCVNR